MGPMRLPKTPLDLLDLDLPRGEPWGYAFALILMGGTTLGTWLFLRWKGWI